MCPALFCQVRLLQFQVIANIPSGCKGSEMVLMVPTELGAGYLVPPSNAGQFRMIV